MKLVHNTEVVVALLNDEATIHTQNTIFTGTLVQCQDEASRLNLLDPHSIFSRRVIKANIPGAREATVTYFDALPSQIKGAFVPVFEAINTLESDVTASSAIRAVTVSNELLPIKAEILRLLNTAPPKTV